jgi:hypothetical protein
MDAERITFQVEVDPAADPISGAIRSGEQELEFVGWVGLAGALERILEEAPATAEGKFGVTPP